jgi:hypothetical protein
MAALAARHPASPLLAALERAPVGELAPEIRATLDQDMGDIAAGRVQPVAHDDVPAWLEDLARRERGE